MPCVQVVKEAKGKQGSFMEREERATGQVERRLYWVRLAVSGPLQLFAPCLSAMCLLQCHPDITDCHMQVWYSVTFSS